MHKSRSLFCLRRESLEWVSTYLASELLSCTGRDRQRMSFKRLGAFDYLETEFFSGEERTCSMCVSRNFTPHLCISRIDCSHEHTNGIQRKRDSKKSRKVFSVVYLFTKTSVFVVLYWRTSVKIMMCSRVQQSVVIFAPFAILGRQRRFNLMRTKPTYRGKSLSFCMLVRKHLTRYCGITAET